jgi:cell division septal protein FtsQ
VAYVLPENLTEALQKAEEEGSKKLKKIKRTRLLVLIILAVIFVACILIPLAANFLPKLLGG